MNQPNPETPLTQPEFKRAWRIVSIAGMLGISFYLLCVTGVPRTKYLTELGATPFDFGLISAAGYIVLVFQIVAGFLVSRLRRRKTVWIWLAAIHRVLMIGMILAPLLFDGDRAQIWWIIGICFLSDALAHTGSPMWFAWMADIVPKDQLNRHWASRQRLMLFGQVLLMIGIAFFFRYFENHHLVIQGFTILAALGVLMGITDILLFTLVPEPPCEHPRPAPMMEILIQPLRDKDFRYYFYFTFYWSFVALLAVPFYFPYMISILKMSVFQAQMLMMIAAAGMLLSSRFWGLICDTYGQRSSIQILAIGKAVITLALVLIPGPGAISVAFLGAALFIDGIMDGGLGLALQGVLLKTSPRENRTMYIAVSNFLAIGVSGAIAPLLAGYFINCYEKTTFLQFGSWHFGAFQAVFLASMFLRLLASPLARRLHEPQGVAARTVLSHICRTNPLQVMWRLNILSESKSDDKRVAAAQGLGNLGSPLAINELIRALQDPCRQVRHAAAEALGRIGMAEACEPLARMLFDSASGIQSPAAHALGLIGGPQSLHSLLVKLRDKTSEALGETIDSLANIGDSAAILPLICLLDELDDAALRRRIASALTQLSERESAEEVVAIFAERRRAI